MVLYTFQGFLYRNKHKTHFSVQKNSIVFYSELFFLLVKTIVYNPYYYCSLIFQIFLSMEVFFRKPNFCLVYAIFFYLKFFPVCGNRKIQFLENKLFPANTNRFLACGNHFFSSSLRHSCHCELYFPSCKNVFLNAFWLVEKHLLASGNAFFIYFLEFSASDSFCLV